MYIYIYIYIYIYYFRVSFREVNRQARVTLPRDNLRGRFDKSLIKLRLLLLDSVMIYTHALNRVRRVRLQTPWVRFSLEGETSRGEGLLLHMHSGRSSAMTPCVSSWISRGGLLSGQSGVTGEWLSGSPSSSRDDERGKERE
jgi:hypothetical protein